MGGVQLRLSCRMSTGNNPLLLHAHTHVRAAARDCMDAAGGDGSGGGGSSNRCRRQQFERLSAQHTVQVTAVSRAHARGHSQARRSSGSPPGWKQRPAAVRPCRRRTWQLKRRGHTPP
jgi:hypothetical protein